MLREGHDEIKSAFGLNNLPEQAAPEKTGKNIVNTDYRFARVES